MGFYHFLDSRLSLKGKNDSWDYVHNQTGGFWGFWWNFKDWRNHRIYLQIEQGNLCLKLEVGEGADPSLSRNEFYESIMEKAKARGRSEIARPGRFGTGNYMTAAIVAKEHWLGADDQVIDKEAVIERLLDYERFLDSFGNGA